MLRRMPVITLCILSLFVSLLDGCARPASSPPVRASWSEQLAAAEGAIKDMGGDFVLVSGIAEPLRDKQGAPDEPVELKVTLLFVRQKSSQLNRAGIPLHAARMVHFIDHRLATTMRVDNEFRTEHPPEPTSPERARLIRLSPQDVLQLTLTEGQAFMAKTVDNTNMTMSLSRVSERPPELNAQAVWNISFYSEKGSLSIWVDAQTGAILKRSTKNK